MVIDRQGDLLVISESRDLPRQRWRAAAFCLVLAGLAAIAGAGSIPFLVLAVAPLVFFAVLFVLIPARRAEIDQKLRQVRIYKGWLWGWGKANVIEFDDVTDLDVHLSRSSEGPDSYFPRLLLASGRPKLLAAYGSAADAESVARAVRHAIFGSSQTP